MNQLADRQAMINLTKPSSGRYRNPERKKICITEQTFGLQFPCTTEETCNRKTIFSVVSWQSLKLISFHCRERLRF